MYSLELEKVISEIKARNSKQVLIQLPDGLKPEANKVIDAIESQTDAKAFLWLTDCFGACDIPLGLDILKIDLMIQFGHNRYWKTQEW
ncbi:MAG TPA: diphthamide synthesis protein [Candidatus Nanoarchaeia archaeon]|nr:diphthamide synthesis protein [Candidatus Nanoarchaeia archaeon]